MVCYTNVQKACKIIRKLECKSEILRCLPHLLSVLTNDSPMLSLKKTTRNRISEISEENFPSSNCKKADSIPHYKASSDKVVNGELSLKHRPLSLASSLTFLAAGTWALTGSSGTGVLGEAGSTKVQEDGFYTTWSYCWKRTLIWAGSIVSHFSTRKPSPGKNKWLWQCLDWLTAWVSFHYPTQKKCNQKIHMPRPEARRPTLQRQLGPNHVPPWISGLDVRFKSLSCEQWGVAGNSWAGKMVISTDHGLRKTWVWILGELLTLLSIVSSSVKEGN